MPPFVALLRVSRGRPAKRRAAAVGPLRVGETGGPGAEASEARSGGPLGPRSASLPAAEAGRSACPRAQELKGLKQGSGAWRVQPPDARSPGL